MNSAPPPIGVLRLLLQRIVVIAGAVALTAAMFLLLPVLQQLAERDRPDTVITPAPGLENEEEEPPPPEPEEKEEEVKEEEPPPPPEPQQELPPPDLSSLVQTSGGSGFLAGGANLSSLADQFRSQIGAGGPGDDLLGGAGFEQRPNPLRRVQPQISKPLSRLGPGSVTLMFVVDTRGRVQTPRVKSSDNPAFNKAALDAIKRWTFEPGKRNGKPARFPMLQRIDFNKN